MRVYTGGSFVKDGYWASCDTYVKDDPVLKVLGLYLIAKGLVMDVFGYFRFRDILVIQSKRNWTDTFCTRIFFGSICKLIKDFPDETFAIPVPFANNEEAEFDLRLALSLRFPTYKQSQLKFY